MTPLARTELLASLDIGTTKVCALVAESNGISEPAVTGIGISRSPGVRKGVIVDLDAAAHSIEEAVGMALRQAGRDVDAFYVGVTGEHIGSLNSSGRIAITHPDREITAADVERVLEAARVIVLPPDRQIIHAIPRSYSIDGQNCIAQPIGMSGVRLEVQTHIVHGATSFLQNVEKAVNRAGLDVAELVLEPIATAEAVLSPEEKELGVCLVDIGGGTTDIAVFAEGEIYYTAVVPVGGSLVTSDIAYGLTVASDEAERLKTESGSALADRVGAEDVITVRQIGRDDARKLRRRALVQIIEPRIQEIFQLVRDELSRADCAQRIPAGLVLSGGGSQLSGCEDVARQIFGAPVRTGAPRIVGGLGETLRHPMYATAVGLLLYAEQQAHAPKSSPLLARHPGPPLRAARSVFKLIKDWFGV